MLLIEILCDIVNLYYFLRELTLIILKECVRQITLRTFNISHLEEKINNAAFLFVCETFIFKVF